MPRPCSICRHPERQAMDQALAANEPFRYIANRFGTSPAALHRHYHGHTQPRAPYAPAVPLEASGLVEAAARVHTTARDVHRQTTDLRSTHQPELLERIEDLTRVLVEVTGLLVKLSEPRLPETL